MRRKQPMAQREIVILTRLPHPGRAKTRLIPALGEEGAARLHAELTAHTLSVVDSFAEQGGTRVTVWVDGPADAAAAAFGRQHSFAEQPEGDLGERLIAAFDAAFERGAPAALAIGTDCPRLGAAILAAAFEALDTAADAVLGPATDGGYYLIGFTSVAWARAREAAFTGVPWSSPRTAAVTRARLSAAGLSTGELPELSDIDEPGDLHEWDAT